MFFSQQTTNYTHYTILEDEEQALNYNHHMSNPRTDDQTSHQQTHNESQALLTALYHHIHKETWRREWSMMGGQVNSSVLAVR